jgi:hypothetical protein
MLKLEVVVQKGKTELLAVDRFVMWSVYFGLSIKHTLTNHSIVKQVKGMLKLTHILNPVWHYTHIHIIYLHISCDQPEYFFLSELGK